MDQNTTPENLTVSDPVDQDTLERFAQLDYSASQIGRRFVDMEMERVRLVRSCASIEQERTKLFEKVLLDRGLAPNTVVHINPQTGEIKTEEQMAEAMAAIQQPPTQ
jgi:molybdate-binding protein